MRPATVIPWLLVAALALVALGGGCGHRDAQPAAGLARVLRVVDGDTIIVRTGDQRERVRYIGIDTPESVKPDTPVQCYAKRASQQNHRLVAGREVRLVFDRERRDRFGRLLAYVYRASDGLFVNLALVRGGFARTIVFEPNTRYVATLAGAREQARRAGLGLWSRC